MNTVDFKQVIEGLKYLRNIMPRQDYISLKVDIYTAIGPDLLPRFEP